MEYQDYDIMLKYQIDQERQKGQYHGNPTIYSDGIPLEIFPEQGDKVNGTKPLFVFGTVVYLCFGEKFLIIDQQKDNKVVDTLVGLGGKVRPLLGRMIRSEEKNEIDSIISAYQSGELATAEAIRVAAAREVLEETSTYYKNANGEYTHQITQPGISINPEKLHIIGPSRIRIIQPTKTECWMILNFSYQLSKQEFEFIKNNVSITNREGNLYWLTKEEAISHMSNADKIVLNNFDKNVDVSEIRDGINNNNIVRFTITNDDIKHIETLVNGSLVYTNDDEIKDNKYPTKR